jgi:hypothetical protein
MSVNLSRLFGTGVLSIQQCKVMRRTIGQTSGESRRKFNRGRRDSMPSVGFILKRSSTRGYTAEHPTDIKRLATSSSPRVVVLWGFSRSSVDVRRLVR